MKSDKILNYRINIDKERLGKKTVYNASCPALGLADFGDTIDEALKHITSLIEFHLETLVELGQSIPVEKDTTSLITSVTVPLPRSAHFSAV